MPENVFLNRYFLVFSSLIDITVFVV